MYINPNQITIFFASVYKVKIHKKGFDIIRLRTNEIIFLLEEITFGHLKSIICVLISKI